MDIRVIEVMDAESQYVEDLKAENAQLKKNTEQLLLKHEKEKNTLLVSLEAATKEIARLKAKYE